MFFLAHLSNCQVMDKLHRIHYFWHKHYPIVLICYYVIIMLLHVISLLHLIIFFIYYTLIALYIFLVFNTKIEALLKNNRTCLLHMISPKWNKQR